MKTIIIPTDFSPAATNALHYGIEMAKSCRCQHITSLILQVPVSYSDVPMLLGIG